MGMPRNADAAASHKKGAPQMQISAELVEGIIGQSNVSFDQGGTRRQSYRAPVCRQATLSQRGLMVRVPVTVVDISLGGIGFLHSTALGSGESYLVRIAGQNGDRLAVECVVRWCKPAGSDQYRIGAEFVKLIDDEEELEPAGRTGKTGFSSAD